jgi:hypothetical protein
MLNFRRLLVLVLGLFLSSLLYLSSVLAQSPNKRLVLKDGSYQVVKQYTRVGDRVRYLSAERGQWEELPAALVDWPATEKWAKEHVPGAKPAPPAPGSEAAEIDKQEQQARAEELARTPEVAPKLRLPDEDGVWALDTFRDQPELIALEQNSGNVNQQTGHNILRSTINPLGGKKQTIELPGAKSKIRLHINDLVLYVSLTADDNGLADPGAVTVDTQGASTAKDKDKHKDNYSSPNSQYAIVRLQANFKHDYRTVSTVKISMTGNLSQTEDIIPTTAEILPGKRWMKLTPRSPLTIGDYALMEILSPGEVNAAVWDFRIDPQAADNKNAIMPLQRSSR